MTFSELMNIVSACEEVTAVFGKSNDSITGEAEILRNFLVDAAQDAEVLEIATIGARLKVWCAWDDETED